MRNVALVCVLLAMGVAAQEGLIHEPKLAKRTLPADVLRDFPGMCFGSTTCRSYPVDATWELRAFCGRSTCMKNETGFFEIVEDCGRTPKANDNCRAIPGTAPTFPDCCFKYECAEGVTLEYPTDAEIKAEIAAARKAAEEQATASPQPAAVA